jgi:hypothetical protein
MCKTYMNDVLDGLNLLDGAALVALWCALENVVDLTKDAGEGRIPLPMRVYQYFIDSGIHLKIDNARLPLVLANGTHKRGSMKRRKGVHGKKGRNGLYIAGQKRRSILEVVSIFSVQTYQRRSLLL